MKCHYEVLDIPRDVDDETLKKSYRKLALRWHPDKNPENIDEATQQFRIIQQAYDVLSDPHERAWYDKHREAILRGGLGTGDYADNCLNVFQYFTASCYANYDDSENGFYAVYRNVFDKIAAEDMEFADESDFEIHGFGTSTSTYEEEVHVFYSHWLSYCTLKSYVWVEKYDTREAPNRRVSRLMEKENKKLRDQAKKKRNEEVRALVAFVRKRDKRVHAYRKILEERAAMNLKKTEEMRRRQLQERQDNLKNYSESGWSAMSTLESELQQIEKSLNKQFGDKECDSEENEENGETIEDSDLYCIACEKLFKNVKGLQNHMNSKKHKENLLLLEEILREEDVNLQSDNLLTEPKEKPDNDDGKVSCESDDIEDDTVEVNDGDDDDSSSGLPEESCRKKQKKKKQKKNSLTFKHKENDSKHSEEELGQTRTEESYSIDDIDKFSGKKQKNKRRNQQLGTTEDKFIETESKEDASDDVLSNDAATHGVASIVTESAPPVIKLKGKKAKEARKKLREGKAKKERKETSNDVDEIRCATCSNEFPTRNKLFNHLKSTGHSIHIPASSSLDVQRSKQARAKVKLKIRK